MFKYIYTIFEHSLSRIPFNPLDYTPTGSMLRALTSQLGAYAPNSGVSVLKTLSFPMAAGNMDYRNLDLRVDMCMYDRDAINHVSTETAVAEWTKVRRHEVYQEHFPQGEKGNGELLQMTIQTVSSVLDRDFDVWECELIEANYGHPEWSIAAMLLGLNCLENTLLRQMLEAKWHLVPLAMWKDVLKDILLALRRCPRVVGSQATEAQVFMLRKIANCTYRSKEAPDWDVERSNRTAAPKMHWMPVGDSIDRDLWIEEMRLAIGELTTNIVGDMASGPILDSMDEWWSARWAWAPQGSTSMRHRLTPIAAQDDRLPAGARPGKKTLWETLSDDFASMASISEPIKVARASVKPEPGGKQRSLYAVDDVHTIVAGYASVHLEKFMNVWGMKGKQTPADVAQWLVASANTRYPSVWVSLDYSDFNTEHELIALKMLDEGFMHAWGRCGHDVAADKVRCARWTANAHANAWVQDSQGEYYRCMGTLFSGDRNTARDNTCLHAVYSRLCLKAAKQHDPACWFIERNYTGDDEDVLIDSWVGAWFYAQMHAQAGFELKPAKQMVDQECHEFLQRNTAPGELTIRPLFAALAQRASGNWYQDVYMWYDTVVQSISSNCWELHTRGMPLLYARRLAAVTINAMMRVPDETASDGWRRLDWWPYRHGVGIAALWYGTPGPMRPPPSIEAKPMPAALMPLNATNAWITRAQIKSGIHLTDDQRREYQEYCAKEGYGKLYVRERADAHKRFALKQWPVRDKSGTIPWFSFAAPVPEPVAPQQVIRWMQMGPSDRRPSTMEEVLSRMELDQRLVEIVGGLPKTLAMIPPARLCRFEWPLEKRQPPISWQYHDSAVAAWLSVNSLSRQLKADDDKYVWVRDVALPNNVSYADDAHALASKASHDQHHAHAVIMLYVAPNAAGKSVFAKSRSDVADMDDIVAYTGMQEQNRITASYRNQLRAYPLAERLEHVVLTAHKPILTTQYDLPSMLRKHTMRSFGVIVTIVEPPVDVRRQRMLARGWDDDKINRRLRRWEDVKNTYITNSLGILSGQERQALRFASSF